MAVYFCPQSGERIAAPGLCKACDPVNGQDDASEAPEAPEAPITKPEPARAGKTIVPPKMFSDAPIEPSKPKPE